MTTDTAAGTWSKHQYRLLNLLWRPETTARSPKELMQSADIDRSGLIRLGQADLVYAWHVRRDNRMTMGMATLGGIGALAQVDLTQKGIDLLHKPNSPDRALRTVVDLPGNWVAMSTVITAADCRFSVFVDLDQAGLVEVVTAGGYPLDHTKRIRDYARREVNAMQVHATPAGRYRAGT